MTFTARTLAAAAALVAAGSASAAIPLTNAGFESPSTANFAYLSGVQAGWDFQPSPIINQFGASGVTSTASGNSFGVTAGDGQAALLQMFSSVSQQVTVASAGTYNVSFAAQGRSSTGGSALSVSLGGPSGSQLLSFGSATAFVPTAGAWNTYTSNGVVLSAGTYLLRISSVTALDNNFVAVDRTSFVDNVALVPEPHEWAMMLAGLGLVGWAARRSKREAAGTPAFAAA